jgi:O-antigen ligase
MRLIAYGALCLFVFTVPWENSLVIPGLGVVTRLTGMLAMGLTIVAVVVTARVRRWELLHVTALLFVIWVGGVLWITSTQPKLPLNFWTYPQLFLMIWMVWELAPTRKLQLGLLVAYLLGAQVTALRTIMAYRMYGSSMRRFSTGNADPNAVAMILALSVPIAWYLGMTYRQPFLRWICRAYLPVGILALALTGSRGGLLAMMVGLLIVPLTMTKLSPGRLAAAIALLALSGGLAVAYVPDRVVERLATTRESVEDLSLGGRYEIWRAGMHAFTHRPLAGYGAGGFKFAASPWLKGELRVAHNSFLSVLVEQGMVGFLLYWTMFMTVFAAAWKLPTMDRRFELVLLATLLVTMLPLSMESSKSVWFLLAALLGLARASTGWPGRTMQQQSPRGPARPREVPRGPRPRLPLSAPMRRAGPDASA